MSNKKKSVKNDSKNNFESGDDGSSSGSGTTPRDDSGKNSSSGSSSNSHPAGASGTGDPKGVGQLGFSDQQTASLMQMISTAVAQAMIQQQGTQGLNPQVPDQFQPLSFGHGINAPVTGSNIHFPTHAATATSTTYASVLGSQTNSGNSSIGTSLHSQSGATGSYPSSSSSNPTHFTVPAPVCQGLYGNVEKPAATLRSLESLPKGADFDTFDEWRRRSIDIMGNTGGMVHVVTLNHVESLELAIKEEKWGKHLQ